MAKPLARPTIEARWDAPPPRRGELTVAERKDLAWILEDYAEMLETCAMGLDPETDRDTQQRADRARAFANRFR